MVRTITISTLLMGLAIFLQSTFASFLGFPGAVPDIALIILVYVSARNGSMEGQVSGFISGIFQDVVSAAPLGFNVFIRTVSGFLFGIFNGNLFIDFVIAPFSLCFGATILKAILAGGLSLLFRGSVHAYSFLDKTLWIEALYNAVLAILVFLILRPFKRFLTTERNRV